MLRVDKRILRFNRKAGFLVLKSVYGIGTESSTQFLKYIGINKAYIISDFRLDLGHYIFNSLSKLFELIEIYLGIQYRRRKNSNLNILKNIKSYRGIRYFFGLPIRGQRRHTNAKTARKALYRINRRPNIRYS